MRPSSTASNSIVALSVSISASRSPERTWSPSFTSHFASLPSSMVGDSAGMRIWIAMPASGEHVRVKLRDRGFRALGGKFRGHVHDLPRLLVDRLELFVGRLSACDQPLSIMFDRIALFAHVLDFLARAVF